MSNLKNWPKEENDLMAKYLEESSAKYSNLVDNWHKDIRIDIKEQEEFISNFNNFVKGEEISWLWRLKLMRSKKEYQAKLINSCMYEMIQIENGETLKENYSNNYSMESTIKALKIKDKIFEYRYLKFLSKRKKSALVDLLDDMSQDIINKYIMKIINKGMQKEKERVKEKRQNTLNDKILAPKDTKFFNLNNNNNKLLINDMKINNLSENLNNVTDILNDEDRNIIEWMNDIDQEIDTLNEITKNFRTSIEEIQKESLIEKMSNINKEENLIKLKNDELEKRMNDLNKNMENIQETQDIMETIIKNYSEYIKKDYNYTNMEEEIFNIKANIQSIQKIIKKDF